MKVNKTKPSDGVGWANKADYNFQGVDYEADLKDGDIVGILNEGVIETHPQWGDSHVFNVETRNGKKKLRFNKASMNILIDAYKDETSKWIGKEALVLLKKTVINDKKVIIAYIVTAGWSLDDYGKLQNESQEVTDDVEEIPV